ncbi:hypothetical protein JCM3775_003141 [Rhodotorula graminis]|uniref:N-acetylglucosaminylphosphatidylinositol deacetylase n=1 Tax=Rhodotorula graminis (strain WP1) TaxID=578459 RepID=A0A0P9IQE8_RHOGW|nr:uncharacterized protein RHOBADRAFT_56490 [Rhodotorula graminis WP1]KPV71656.1 hypothetical protein RHOBADRAFT_56490 [Rhodotorula graminis WP1]
MPRLRRSLRIAAARALVLLVLAAVLLVATKHRFAPRLVPPDLAAARSVLWVTAHPDDESFFFAPSILTLLDSPHNAQGALLCLSIGNHDGLGGIRRQELGASCDALGIARDRCTALDLPTLRDDPTVWWETEEVEQVVRRYVKAWDVDAVISFDDYGVSGHANHRALSSALSSIAAADPSFPPVYAVESTSVLAKYTSLVLLPLALLARLLPSSSPSSSPSSALFVNSLAQYRATRRSFAAHESQAVWFRTLFVGCSRYLWWVELRRVGG